MKENLQFVNLNKMILITVIPYVSIVNLIACKSILLYTKVWQNLLVKLDVVTNNVSTNEFYKTQVYINQPYKKISTVNLLRHSLFYIYSSSECFIANTPCLSKVISFSLNSIFKLTKVLILLYVRLILFLFLFSLFKM
jgi:hypothetical protein